MNLIDHIVVDVETQKTIEETPGGWEATDKLGVACAVVYEYRADRFRVYGPNDVEMLKERLLRATRVTGFNTWKFDFPVIWGFPGRERVESLWPYSDDILRRIWQALNLNADQFSDTHEGWGLNSVVKDTLHRNSGKIGYGGDAPKWYQSGQWCRLITYCIDDVALERDLSDFIDKHGYVVNVYTGQKVEIEPWTPQSLPHR